MTRMPFRYSCNRLAASIFARMCRALSFRCMPEVSNTNKTAIGNAAKSESAIRQSRMESPVKARTGMMIAPNICGTRWEIPCSSIVKSPIIILARSPGSRLFRYPSGNWRKCSARRALPSAAALYALRNWER
ncbi:hypothetical protein D1872_228090 [compost metagenome]